MDKKQENQVVSSDDFRADPGSIIDRAKAGPVTITSSDDSKKSVMIAIPRINAKGEVTLK